MQASAAPADPHGGGAGRFQQAIVSAMTWAAALAAVVSILAALAAAREARSVTTLNHKIAALDRQAEQMRDDYRDLMTAIGGNTDSPMVRYGSVLAAGEVLRANPQVNEPLSATVVRLTDAFAAALQGGSDAQTRYVFDHIESIRDGFRESMADLERTRSDLLS